MLTFKLTSVTENTNRNVQLQSKQLEINMGIITKTKNKSHVCINLCVINMIYEYTNESLFAFTIKKTHHKVDS